MVREITSNTETQIDTRYATEPIIIIGIEWQDGTVHYADKTITIDGTPCLGCIISFSAVNAAGKQDDLGEVSSLSVALDDTMGDLKVRVNTLILEGLIVTAYHYYVGTSWTDKTVLMKGKLAGPINWSEGERLLSFEVESFIEDNEIGYSTSTLANMNIDAVDKAWPLCFGTVLKVPTLPIFKTPISKSTEAIYGGYDFLEEVPFKVENGELFPQGENIYLVVHQTKFYGSFDGNMFNRTISNLTWFTNVSLASRPAGDADVDNKYVCWTTTPVSVAGKWCWLGISRGFNYCESQDSEKCYFKFPWQTLLSSSDTFVEVRGQTMAKWFDNNNNNVLNYWVVFAQQSTYQLNISSAANLFIANLYPSVEILEVYGNRDLGGEQVFVPIPSSYYLKHLNYSLDGQNVTAIEFPRPIETLENQGWSGDVFVSLRSTLSSNVSDVIKFLVETYTDFNAEVASFSDTKIKTNPYPVNFALLEREEVLSVIADIAWQARCVVYNRNGVVSIKYLSEEVTPVFSLDSSAVILKSIDLGFTDTDEIFTRLIGSWKIDYSGEPETLREIVYRNNVDAFGLKTIEKEFYIYNNGSLAKMSAYFWGYRYSNSWRIVQLSTVLKTLSLELFDAIINDINIISSFAIKGIIEDTSHDSATHEIALKYQLASKAGESTGGQPIEDPNYWIGDPAYPVQARVIPDPASGLQEVDYTVIESGENSTENVDTSNSTTADRFYVFIAPTFTEIERDIDFTITIQLQDSGGNKVNQSPNAVLSLHSDDPDDVLSMGSSSEYDITLSNGEYTISTAEINDGSGFNVGYLSCVDKDLRVNYNAGVTSTFDIIDIKTAALSWVTQPPVTITRGVTFPVSISGGTGGATEDISIDPSFTDASDKLYDNATKSVITELELSTGGTYTGTWYVDAGEGSEVSNSVTLKDTTNQKYEDLPSGSFDISGSAIQYIEHTVTVQHIYAANANTLDITFVDGELNDETIFNILIEFKNADGDAIEITTDVYLEMHDTNGSVIPWIIPSSGNSIITPMVDGLALGASIDCSVNLAEEHISPATITAQLTYNSEVYTGTLTKSWLAQQLIDHSLVTSQVGSVPGSQTLDVTQELLPTDVAGSPLELEQTVYDDMPMEQVVEDAYIAVLTEYEVTSSVANAVKGQAFNLTITAKDQNGDIITSNEEILSLTITGDVQPITLYDSGDSPINVAPLVDGTLTISSCYLDGGTATQNELNCNIHVTDSLVTGDLLLPLLAKLVELTAVAPLNQYVGADAYFDDTDPYTQPTCGQWTTLTASAISECEADTVPAANDYSLYAGNYDFEPTYERVTIDHYRGSGAYEITAEDLVGVTEVWVYMTLVAYTTGGYFIPGSIYYSGSAPYWHDTAEWGLVVSATAFASGNFGTVDYTINLGDYTTISESNRFRYIKRQINVNDLVVGTNYLGLVGGEVPCLIGASGTGKVSSLDITKLELIK